MPQHHTRRLRRWLLSPLALAACLALPQRAASQQCTEEPCGPLDRQEPTITISPGSATRAPGAVTVTIGWSDDYQLSDATRSVTFGPQAVTGSFSYSKSNNWTATSTGSVTVPSTPGNHTLTASICDAAGNCGSQSVTYTIPAPAVRVTPEATTQSVAASSGGAARYRVVNTGAGISTYTLAGYCPAGFTSCAGPPGTLTLAPGDSAWADVTFTTPASGSGWVQLTAATGSVSSFGGTTVSALAAPDPGFPGDTRSMERVERTACVILELGPSAVSECGDLRVVHPLSSTRVMNKSWTPALVYNSDHARPFPIVAEHLTGPAGTPPDSIRAVLLMNGTQVASTRWKGWGADQTRRIAISFDATAYTTGLHPYTLQVTAEWLNGTQQTLVNRTGRMVIVNRSGSPFGAGWWLSGVEQLVSVPGDTAKVWVGADGSARVYRGPAGGPWHAAGYDRPDSLYRAASPIGTVTVRTLPGRRSEVWFDSQDRHVRSINFLWHYVGYRWNGTQLTGMTVPYASEQGDSIRYTFEYNNHPTRPVPRLSRVAAPGISGTRDTWVVADTLGRVSRITDLDSSFVSFLYSGATRWMTRRTDRKGVATSFGYLRVRVHSGSEPLNATQNALVRVQAAQTLGMNGVSVRADSVHVIYDGPRTEFCDCYWWKVDRYGAATSSRDPYGQVNTLQRGDPRWPGRVTRVVAHNGHTLTATYDDHGNAVSETSWNPYGDGRNATTTYEYDRLWDAPTRIVAPEGEVTTMAYDNVRRRVWEQAGSDATRRVSYSYYPNNDTRAPGLMQSVILPTGGAERFEYDTRGNLSASVSPLNGTRTEFLNDALGRLVRTRVPAESSPGQFAGWKSDSTVYDRMGQPIYAVTVGPAMNDVPEQQVHVRSEYDLEGNLRVMERWSVPDLEFTPVGVQRTEWRYDLAGRSVAEIAADGAVDSTYYDLAGNVSEVHTRRTDPTTGQRLVLRMTYDANNRLLTKQVPTVTYGARDMGIPQKYRTTAAHCTGVVMDRTYPQRPNDGACGLIVGGYTESFTYDVLGNLTHANNPDAQVRRTYYSGGALATDSLRIRPATGPDMSVHAYGLAYQYDRNGRRTQLTHPSQLAPSSTQNTVRYTYDRITGGLASVTDPLGNEFTYEYNNSGQIQRRTFVGGASDQFEYWADGSLSAQITSRANPLQTLRNTSIWRDAAGRVLEARNYAGTRDSISVRYSGLGHAVSTYAKYHLDSTADPSWFGRETFSYDALGNMVREYQFSSSKGSEGRHESYSDGTSGFWNGTARLSGTTTTSRVISSDLPAASRRDDHVYDAAGNVVFSTQLYQVSGSCSSQPKVDADCEDRALFYGADGRLRAADHRVRMGDDNGNYYRATWEEYRYDALGRRVWVRSLLTCPTGGAALTKGWPLTPCNSSVRRTVWDGDKELWEIQMPGSDTSSYLENDVNPVPPRQWINWYPDARYDQPGGIYDYSKYSWYDPNPLHGRVAYTHGLGVDQPLSLVRIGLSRYYPATYPETVGTGVSFAPFAAVPLWDWRGQLAGTVYAGGADTHCQVFSGVSRCAGVAVNRGWSAYTSAPMPAQWHGTLMNGKTDAAGTQYRRARYYDPGTGRFTQEDPTGLAGGLNLYGYAGGDPVNFADPGGEFAIAVPLLVGLGGAVIGAGVGYYRGGWSGAAKGALIGGAAGLGVGGVAVRMGLLPATIGAAALPVAAAGAGGTAGGTTVSAVALDTNALIAVLEGSPTQAASVLTKMAGRSPYVSRTVVREFLRGGGSREALRQFLTSHGGGVIAAGPRSMVQALMSAGLHAADAEIVASAISNGMGLITRDRRLYMKLIPGIERLIF